MANWIGKVNEIIANIEKLLVVSTLWKNMNKGYVYHGKFCIVRTINSKKGNFKKRSFDRAVTFQR